ncbi:MAG: hypothetical protein K0R47_1384 [Brevibacillus sp.]|nr:hypothetical protein [Brevibacillus sp.]
MTSETGRHQRDYFRLKLEYPLCADMTIVLIKGKAMEIGSTKVLVEDLGAGGLRFLSHLKMPANDQLVLQFDSELCAEPITMYGHIVRTTLWQEEFYEYAVRFTMEESQHLEINRLVNRLAIRYRNQKEVKDGRFWKDGRREFLLQQADLSLQSNPN